MTQHRQFHNRGTVLYVAGKAAYIVVGRYLRKTFKPNHILRKPPGLAADVDILTEAIGLGAEYCQFTSAESGDIYFAPIDWLLAYGVRLDRGYGVQKVLPLTYWSVNGEPPKRRPAAIVAAEKEAERLARNEPEQLSLFGIGT